jgi:DNA-binding NtrC family response regulator
MHPIDPAAETADRPRVLLVDPHEQTRVLLGQLLLDAGCEVVTVPNHAQALVGARRERPTVIVTELRGGTVLPPAAYVTALRRHSPAPVIVHSGVTPSAEEARGWGVWGVVVKGGRPAALLDMTRDAHAAHRAVRARP